MKIKAMLAAVCLGMVCFGVTGAGWACGCGKKQQVREAEVSSCGCKHDANAKDAASCNCAKSS